MSVNDLVSKIVEKKSSAETAKEDLVKQWQNELNELYNMVESWFEAVPDGSVKTERNPHEYYENRLGAYTTSILQISLDNYTIRFVPTAKDVIGAEGRVDLHVYGADYEPYILLLGYDENGAAVWKATKKGDKKSLEIFNEEVFERFLNENIMFEER